MFSSWSTAEKYTSIKYIEKIDSKNLNNSTSVQIIIEQSNSLTKLLKSIIEKIEKHQLEVLNEVRHLQGNV